MCPRSANYPSIHCTQHGSFTKGCIGCQVSCRTRWTSYKARAHELWSKRKERKNRERRLRYKSDATYRQKAINNARLWKIEQKEQYLKYNKNYQSMHQSKHVKYSSNYQKTHKNEVNARMRAWKPKWRKTLRQRIIDAHGGECHICHSKEKPEIHHKSHAMSMGDKRPYVGLKISDAANEDIVILYSKCHRAIGALRRLLIVDPILSRSKECLCIESYTQTTPTTSTPIIEDRGVIK